VTPGVDGLPAGLTLKQFIQVLKNGHDVQKVHPTGCGQSRPVTAICIPYPENPAMLQTMIWPTLGNFTQSDLTAIYAYLSAIPCISNKDNANGPATPNSVANKYPTLYPVIVRDCPAAGVIKYYNYYWQNGRAYVNTGGGPT
jgi:hypothetical protein